MGLLRSSNSDSIKIHPQKKNYKKNLAELNYVWWKVVSSLVFDFCI